MVVPAMQGELLYIARYFHTCLRQSDTGESSLLVEHLRNLWNIQNEVC